MKTRIMRMWTAGALVAVVPLLGGCEQSAVSEPTTAQTNSATLADPLALTLESPAPATTNPPPLAEPGTNRPVVADLASAENKPLPPGLAVSPSLGHILKMAGAGVDLSVMISFITNSAGTFNLGAEQIIYLKDLGVSGEIVNAMIAHDQAISSGQFVVTASTVPTLAVPATAEVGGAAPAAGAATASAESQPVSTTADVGQPQVPEPPAGMVAQTAPQPQEPATTAYFQGALSPYGSWVDVEGYGTCWQPTVTVINTAWRPYSDGGRWLYTDCGWYWQSDYAWGGVAFHYGRWFYAPRHGWCWWPNTVWGPSWVTWRSSSAYCGWAPLPPYACYNAGVGLTYYGNNVSVSFGFGLGAGCYTFVPWNGFCQSRPWVYAVPHHRVGPIYAESHVVNHIAPGQGHAPVNHGIEVNQVTARAGRDVPRGTVREVQAGHGAVRPDHVERQGNQHVVYRAASPTAREMTGVPQEPKSPATRSAFATPHANRNLRTPAVGTAPAAPTTGARPSTSVARHSEMQRTETSTSTPRPTPPVSPFSTARAPHTDRAAAPATASATPSASRFQPQENSYRSTINGRSNPWRSQSGTANNPTTTASTPSPRHTEIPQPASSIATPRPTPPVSPFSTTRAPQTASAAPAQESSYRSAMNGRANSWRSPASTANNPAVTASTPSAGHNPAFSARATTPGVWDRSARRTPTHSQPNTASSAVTPQHSMPTAPRPSTSITMPTPPTRPSFTPPAAMNRPPTAPATPNHSAPPRTFSAPPSVGSAPGSPPSTAGQSAPTGRSGRSAR